MGGSAFPGGGGTPDPHASTHENGGADEITVENLATSGGLGTVPTSDGLGGLTMQTPAGGGGTPAGHDKQIQWNDAGSFGAVGADEFFGRSTNGGVIISDGASPSGVVDGPSKHYAGSTFMDPGIVCSVQDGFSGAYTYCRAGDGGIAHGYIRDRRAVGATSRIEAAAGAHAFGEIDFTGGNPAYCTIFAQARGALAHGEHENENGYIRANQGAHAFGKTGSIGGGYQPTRIGAYGDGSLAHGLADGDGAEIQAYGIGSHAHGKARAGFRIQTQGFGYPGSVARGYAHSYDIYTNGRGALAMGYTPAGSQPIAARANNCVQIGPGENNEPYSLAVGYTDGYGTRIFGNRVPSLKRNGDIWLYGGYVYARSNAADFKMAGYTGSGSFTNFTIENGLITSAS